MVLAGEAGRVGHGVKHRDDLCYDASATVRASMQEPSPE